MLDVDLGTDGASADKECMAGRSDFPASAAASLVQGYCDDFVQLAATMAQTLEQVSMRGLELGDGRESLARVERGMRDLADAIQAMLSQPDGVRSSASQVVRSAAAEGDGEPAMAADQPAVDDDAAFQGNTSSMPMRSVLQFLGRMRKTGRLRVDLPGEQMTLDLVDGTVTGTTSTRPERGERVSELLTELGIVDAADLEPYRAQAKGPIRIGATLVQDGVISQEQLAEVFEQQVRRRLDRLARSPSASYAFHEGARSGSGARTPLRPMELRSRM